MKRLLYCIIGLVLGSLMSSWTLSYKQPWSLQHNDHSMTNAINHIFFDIYNLNYLEMNNRNTNDTQWKYDILMNSGFLDSIKFRINDTIFLHFDGIGHFALWNNSTKKKGAYSIFRYYRENMHYLGSPKGISKECLTYFNNWDSISARNFHDSILSTHNPDYPYEIIRFIVTRNGMRINGFEY